MLEASPHLTLVADAETAGVLLADPEVMVQVRIVADAHSDILTQSDNAHGVTADVSIAAEPVAAITAPQVAAPIVTDGETDAQIFVEPAPQAEPAAATPASDGVRLVMQRLGGEDPPYSLQQFPLPGDIPSLQPPLVAACAPGHRAVEQLRSVRMQLMMPATDGSAEPPVVAIVGNERGVGRSFIAANLAIVFAQIGCKTLLIDADLRNPSQHTLFKLDNTHGLSTLLSRRGGIDCIQRVAALPNLHVLTSGPQLPNSQELLEQPDFGQLLKYAAGQCGAVIIDTPAIELGNGAHRVAFHARQTLLVVRRGHTHTAGARRLIEGLRRSRANLSGMIYNAL